MHRLSVVLLALVPAVVGQTLNTTFLSGFEAALNGAGLSKLAAAVQQISTTSIGAQVLGTLSSGDPMLMFAPNDQAWADVSLNNLPDNDIADMISYYIVSGNFNGVSSTFPNNTLGRTLLDDPNEVQLEGNSSQVVAWSIGQDGKNQVLNQLAETTVLSTSTFENILLYVVDRLVDIPANLISTVSLRDLPLTNLVGNLSSIPIPLNTINNETLFEVLNSNDHGFTLFAPNDAAMNSAILSNPSLLTSPTTMQNLLLNHIINSTTVYSPLFLTNNYVSAGGQGFTLSANASGQYVTSGGVTAHIVQPDVLVSNGVVHIIDTVLLNTNFNGDAASSAVNAATASPTQITTGVGPVGQTGSPSSGAPSPSGSGASRSGSGSGSGSNSAIGELSVPTALLLGLFSASVGALW